MKDFNHPDYSEEDIAAAVLTMVVSASTVIARAFSRSVASSTGAKDEKLAQESVLKNCPWPGPSVSSVWEMAWSLLVSAGETLGPLVLLMVNNDH